MKKRKLILELEGSKQPELVTVDGVPFCAACGQKLDRSQGRGRTDTAVVEGEAVENVKDFNIAAKTYETLGDLSKWIDENPYGSLKQMDFAKLLTQKTPYVNLTKVFAIDSYLRNNFNFQQSDVENFIKYCTPKQCRLIWCYINEMLLEDVHGVAYSGKPSITLTHFNGCKYTQLENIITNKHTRAEVAELITLANYAAVSGTSDDHPTSKKLYNSRARNLLINHFIPLLINYILMSWAACYLAPLNKRFSWNQKGLPIFKFRERR